MTTVVTKEIECIFVAGKWKCELGQWDFEIDERRMCRVVHFVEGVSLEELCSVVGSAYGGSETYDIISLSYLCPDLESLAIGRRTPPVVLTTDSSLRTCCRHLLQKRITNIFVSFVGTGDLSAFVTPCLGQKRKLKNAVGGCTFVDEFCESSTRIGDIDPLDKCFMNRDFIRTVEAIEKRMRSSGKKPSSVPRCNLDLEEENDSGSSSDSFEGEDYDIRSRGYDSEFWEPLLEDTFGGSNAADIMFEDESSQSRRNESREFAGGRSGTDVEQTNGQVSNHMRSVTRGVTLTGNFNYGQHSRATTMHGSSARTDRDGPRPGSCKTNVDENDVPPLFDDTLYETFVIPDLDFEDGDETIAVGRTFISKTDCQIALAVYAIRNMFYFKQRRTTKNHFVVTCADLGCGWMVNARKRKENAYYRIRKAILDHTCSIETRSNFTKMATSKVIAHVYKSKYGVLENGPKPKNLQQIVLEDLRVSTSYSKCWRANLAANEGVRGTEEESYLKVEEYLHMVRIANPGSVTDLKTEVDDKGVERFLYLFLAFGGSIAGFKCLRPVLVLDGTHLSGKYKGVLLTASGQDANFQVFPLAFAVVDSENDSSWNWFLSRVKDIIGDSPSLAIISDRHRSIVKATKAVFKSAKHGACIVHLARNVISRFKNKGIAKLVMKAGCAYRVKPFRDLFEEIRSRNALCAKYLEEIGFENWARAYFTVNRFNLMTSNIAESLNNALKNGRRATIIELLRCIQTMLMRWFSTRREKALATKGLATPEVDRIITSNLKLARGSKVTTVSSWSCEVVGVFGKREYVQLEEKKCTCKSYDILKIPCGHALIAAGEKRVAVATLVGDVYRTAVWAKTYEVPVIPNGEAGGLDIAIESGIRVVKPPRTKRPCGRPRVNRIQSTGEISELKTQRRCGRCGAAGHNKSSCKNPI